MKTSTSKNKNGLLIVLSSPSGGGKTTIAHAVLKKDKNIVRSISCTTRKPRAGEKNGRDYFFITPSKFKSLIAQKSFLEWANVHRNFYGTPRHWVDLQLRKGKDVLFVIDVQGGKTIKRKAPDSVLIFVRPPSLTVLKQRLLLRRSEDAKTLKIRQADARWEIREGRRYDHQVVNDRLKTAIADVSRIISRARRKNRHSVGTLVLG